MMVGGPQEEGTCQEGCRQFTNTLKALSWGHWQMAWDSEEEMWQDGVWNGNLELVLETVSMQTPLLCLESLGERKELCFPLQRTSARTSTWRQHSIVAKSTVLWSSCL